MGVFAVPDVTGTKIRARLLINPASNHPAVGPNHYVNFSAIAVALGQLSGDYAFLPVGNIPSFQMYADVGDTVGRRDKSTGITSCDTFLFEVCILVAACVSTQRWIV